MQQPAPRRALIPVKRVCTLVIALWLITMVGSRSTLLAQDVPAPTAEATSESSPTTETPTLSTEAPVFLPTAEAVLPTEDVSLPTEDAPLPTAEAPVATAEATLETTSEPGPVTTAEAPIVVPTSFTDSFTDWTGAGWDVVDWLVRTEEDGSSYFITSGGASSATIQEFRPADFQLKARLRIADNNVAEILVRSELENYRVVFSSLGASRLMRGETVLAASAAAPLPQPAEEASTPQWFNITITAAGGTLGVSVNDVPQIAYTDPLPLVSGMIVFKPASSNTGEIAVDDVSVVTIDPLTTVIPTPDAAPVLSTAPAPEATAEATVDATAEATLEATAEATADATLEATAEATLEATAEATAESTALTPEGQAKLPEQLSAAFAAYISGDVVSATTLFAEQEIYPDSSNRIYLVVFHDGSQDIASLVTQGGGEIVFSDVSLVRAYIPLKTVPNLANNPAVTRISLPSRAVSTGPIATGSGGSGKDYLESFDPLGATDWHDANILGAGVKIAVIDTGFGQTASPFNNPPTTGDFACLKESAPRAGQGQQPNNNHGRNVLEVVCDIAPGSLTYSYQASDYFALGSAISQAISDDMDIILVTLDLGASAAPGDGDGVSDSSNWAATDPYNQIKRAHDLGIPVIVAAGNSGNNGVNGVINAVESRYAAYAPGANTVQITITKNMNSGVVIGDKGYIHVGYRGTSISPSLTGGIPFTDDQWGRVYGPISCPNSPSCQYTLTISGTTSSLVHVQVMGGSIATATATPIADAGNLGRPADSPNAITVGAVCSDFAQNFPIYPQSSRGPIYGPDGTLPISLPNVANTALTRATVKPDIVSFANVLTSGSTTDGDDPPCTVGFSGTSSAAAHVAGMVALMMSVSPDVNPSMTADRPTSFNRTQFQAPVTAVTNVLNYLQSHTVEMPFGSGPTTANSVEKPDETDANSLNIDPTHLVGANGFDMVYGAGLSVLGSPFYDLGQTVNATSDPDQLPASTTDDGDSCVPASTFYVGQANPGDAVMDGTILHPFVHIAYAYNRVGGNACIIVMPGEYVSPLLLQPFNITSTTPGASVTGRSIYSYDDVRVDDPGASIFWMNTQFYNRRVVSTPQGSQPMGGYYGTAQIVAEGLTANTNRSVVSGFIYLATHMLGQNTAGVSTANTHIKEPQGVLLYNSKDVTIRNSSFGEAVMTYFYGEADGINITYPGLTNDADPSLTKSPLIGVSATMIVALSNGTASGGSDGLIIEGNRFVGNTIGSVAGYHPPVFWVEQSGVNGTGSDIGYATKRVRFSGNVVERNSNRSDGDNAAWATIIKANLSAIDITDNMFTQNTSENIIATSTSSETDPLETRIMGNVFLSNVATTPAGEGDSGPLINLFYVRSLYFMNNTVVKNTALGTKYGGLLIRGTPLKPGVSLYLGSMSNAVNQVWEIHNNIFYSNSFSRGLADDALRAKIAGQSYECDDVRAVPVDFAGAKKNWSYQNGVDNSACSGVINGNPIGNGNVISTDPAPLFLGSDPVLALNPISNPFYYALNNKGVGAAFDGVDVGDKTLGAHGGTDIIGGLDFSSDVDGGARAVLGVDMGAFEFETLKFTDGFARATVTGKEDTALVISLDQLSYLGGPIVTGGSGALSFEIITWPADYGTHCAGGTFTDSNKGVIVTGKVLKYCPPRNFFTDNSTDPGNAATAPGTGPQGLPDISGVAGYWPDNFSIEFKVRDASGQRTTDTRFLDLLITQDDDADLTGSSYTYVVTSSRQRIPIQLRPYVTFSVPGSTAFNVPYAPKISDKLAADFPYIYNNANVIDEPTGDQDLLYTQTELDAAFAGLQTNFDATGKSGLIYLDLAPAGINETGYKKFSYNVTDRHGNTATYTVTVRVASTIPNNGLYDDASFAFSFDDALDTNVALGGWDTSVSSPSAINNTLHRTNKLNDQFSVEYKGTGFVLYLRTTGTGSGDIDVDILQGETPLTMSNWTSVTLPTGGTIRQATIAGSGGGICYTLAPIAMTTTPPIVPIPTLVNGNVPGVSNFTITCENMTTVASTYTVRVKNASNGKFLVVDAISILNPILSSKTLMTPGYYDVDAKLMRDLFTAPWAAVFSPTTGTTPKLSKLIAMAPPLSITPPPIVFTVDNATGFAIETVLEAKSPVYTICVTPQGASTPKTCQKYTNSLSATQPFTTNIFRPFYGLDVGSTYDVTVAIDGTMPAGARLVIDSITVFGDSIEPTGELPLSNVDDLRMDWFVMGGGREDGWAFNGAATNSLNSTLTTSSTGGTGGTGHHIGPFVAFKMPQAADAFILKYTYATTVSTAWMVCVDRIEMDTDYGNCLRINPRAVGATPIYDRTETTTNVAGGFIPAVQTVMATGAISNQPLQGTLLIQESMFDATWSPASHTVEIFSLSDAAINFDMITPLDTSTSFKPGSYEEVTPGLRYFYENVVDIDANVDAESTLFTTAATAPWTLLTMANYSGNGALLTKQQNASVAFNMSGATGFAPRLQLSTASDMLKVCWKSPEAAIDTTRVNDVLLTGQCTFVETEATATVYRVDRPFFGFNPGTSYTVVVQTIGDTYTPAPRTASVTMTWDGVTILGAEYNPTTIQSLTPDTLTEFSFKNRVADKKFLYFGANWATKEGSTAPGRSATNFDTASGLGASVVFKVDSNSAQDAIIFLRDTTTNASYSDWEVCATKADYSSARTCAVMETTTAIGSKVPGIFYLPASGTYIISVTTLSNGPIALDAVRHIEVNSLLQAGRYEDTAPQLRYGQDTGPIYQSAKNLVFNGDMEAATTIGWTTVGTAAASVSPTAKYSGGKSLKLNGFTANGGVDSSAFDLQANTNYAVVARVYTTAKFGTAKINVQLVNGTTPFGPIATLDIGTANTALPINTWQPLRIDIPSTGALRTNIHVRILVSEAPVTATTFVYIDDVSVVEGSGWDVFPGAAYTGGTITRSNSHGAKMTFTFSGTGFNVGTVADTLGGKFEICYGPGSTLPASPTCMTYLNEATAASRTLTRGVSGLPNLTYTVRIRDLEEGYLDTTAAVTEFVTRAFASRVGRIGIDFIDIFNAPVPPTIASSQTINENAVDSNGNPYIQLEPSNRWRILDGTLAPNRSGGTVAAQVDPVTNNATSLDGGASATFSVNIPASQDVTLIVYTGFGAGYSNTFLACVDGVSGNLNYNNVLKKQFTAPAATNCAVVTSTANLPFFVLNDSMITALGSTGSAHAATVSLRTLTPGYFYLDGLTVLYGSDLIPGYYENSQTASTADLMIGTAPTDWVLEASASHSGGYALTSLMTTLVPAGTLTLHLEDSTGLTIFTASGPQNKGIEVTVDSDTNANVYTKTVTLPATAGYKIPVTIAGLPQDDYTVTIKLPAAVVAPAKLTVDAVEVYGLLQTLGSLYDDASVAPGGVPYLTYTPNSNAAWSFVSGTTAANHLELTYHQTKLLDAGVAFQVVSSQGLILHYGPTTNTNIRVCLTTAAGVQKCTVDTPLNSTLGKSRLISFSTGSWVDSLGAPTTAPGVGAYSVSIVNALAGKTLTLDAVQVMESGALAEGIYDALFLSASSNLHGTWTTPTIAANLAGGSPTAYVEFTFTGIGFSLVLNESIVAATATASTYSLCIVAGNGPCTTPVVLNQYLTPASISRGGFTADYALTASGLQINTSTENTYTVRVTNTGTGSQKLNVRSLHILGYRPGVLLDIDDGRVENNDPRLRYLPFGSLTETVIKTAPVPSAFSQQQGALRGAGVYFEFVGGGFEYGRTTATTYGGYGYCYAPINATGTPSFTCTSGTGANTASPGAQRVDAINTTGCNTAPGCWVRLYSTDTKLLPVDFIRVLAVNAAQLTAGVYEENNPSLHNVRYDGADFFLNEEAPALSTARQLNASASGGYVRQYSIAPTAMPNSSALTGGMAFAFHGTGFGVNFVRNAFADAVKICYMSGFTSVVGGDIPVILSNDDCVVLDNYSTAVTYNQMRAIQGLPEGDYGVFVQLLNDNYRAANNVSPQMHITTTPPTQTPIQMLIDNVTIFNDPWYVGDNPAGNWSTPTKPATDVLTPGRVYETNYLNRVAQNQFWYNGPWSTLAVTGGYADRVALAGSSLIFRTSGASGMTLYVTPNPSSGAILACARHIDDSASPAVLESAEKTHCQILQTRGTGNRYPIPFSFLNVVSETDNTEYVVSIVTMDNAFVQIDAVELFDTTAPMQAGVYESSSPFIKYSEFTPFDNVLPNSSFAGTCSPWTTDGASAVQSTPFADPSHSCLVTTTLAGKGILSPAFKLQAGTKYLLVARVYLTSLPNTAAAGVRMFSTVNVGITDVTQKPLAPVTGLGKWYTISQEFTATTNTATQLRFESTVAGTGTSTNKFAIDALWLIPKGRGQWEQLYNTLYSGTSAMRTQTPGAQAAFTFTGTGFSVKMPTDPASGKVNVCYGIAPLADKCFIYAQDSTAATYDVSRVVAGLPLGTYSVLISEADDGFSGTAATKTPRLPTGIVLDSVTIFGNEGTPIEVPVIGQYEQTAGNTSGGSYLVKLPAANWRDFAAATWTGGTASQVTTPAGVVTNGNAGATAAMVLDKTITLPTVIVYNRVPTNQSVNLLVCATNSSTRANLQPEIIGGVSWSGTAFVPMVGSANKCIVHNLRSGNQIILTSTLLPALSINGEYKLITFTTLTPGGFNLDAFEVIAGGVLPAGLHDEVKPDLLLNFDNSQGTGQIGILTSCNPRLGWCTAKNGAYYGSSTAYTRQRGARLKFSFEGTGFSAISSVITTGAEMRICLAPASVVGAFPDDNTPYYGNPSGLPETWCDVVTTKYLTGEWTTKNPDRVFPEAQANQYGFAYYGLEEGIYQVEIRHIDLNAPDTLMIDAISIFGKNQPSLDAGLYDDRQAGIVYEPAVNWQAVATTAQLPYFKTEMKGVKAGSIVRLSIKGNALTIYQTMRADVPASTDALGVFHPFVPGNSRDVRVCLMVGDGPIPCEPEAMALGERATAGYRQSAFGGAGVPILIYGLGPGDHNLIIENRDMRTMSIDAFRIHPEP